MDNDWRNHLVALTAGERSQPRYPRVAHSGFRRRLTTAMLRSSNGLPKFLAQKAVQHCELTAWLRPAVTRYFIARGIGGWAVSDVPDRLRGGYLRPSPASFGNSGPRDASWWHARPGGLPGLLCPTCRLCVAASLPACPSSSRVAVKLP